MNNHDTSTLVCGAPGSGKSTYVQNHHKLGDIVVDYDTLLASLAAAPPYVRPDALITFTIKARDAIISIPRPRGSHLWVIVSAPTVAERRVWRERLGACSAVILATPPALCKERVRERPGTHWDSAIDLWWARAAFFHGEMVVYPSN